jgi:hypothetical protein
MNNNDSIWMSSNPIRSKGTKNITHTSSLSKTGTGQRLGHIPEKKGEGCELPIGSVAHVQFYAAS